MTAYSPITPKSQDGVLRAISIGRISTPHQDLESIDASHDADREFLKTLYAGQIELTTYGDQASGWKVKRETVTQAMDAIATGRYDIVVMADIGRAFRNPAFQHQLAQHCRDHRTRLICLRDGIDTADPHWEIMLHNAVMRHGMMVPETRRRVRDKATYLFHKGGMVVKVHFGYRRLTEEEAASGEFGPKGLEIAKLDEHTPVIREIRIRILRGESYEDIARWLNDTGVPTGPYVKSNVWIGRLVIFLMRSPLLHGLRRFRDRLFEMIYSTGSHRRDKNPSPEKEYHPELAHMTLEEQQELWAAMDARTAEDDADGSHPRQGTARKQSYFPGRHLRCAACGELLYWLTPVLKCKGASPGRPRTCWNQLVVDPQQVIDKLIPVLLHELRSRPEELDALVVAAHQEASRQHARNATRLDSLIRRIRELERMAETIVDHLVSRPDSAALLGRLDAVEKEQLERKAELAAVQEQLSGLRPVMSREEVAVELESVVRGLLRDSYEFANVMRRMFPELIVVPVQALDTPQVRPRIKLTIPAGPDGQPARTVTVDAFDSPLHIRHAIACRDAQAANPDLTLTQIGELVGVSKRTAHQALQYARLMEENGSDDPFVELTTRPARASRWRSESLAAADDTEVVRARSA